MVWWLLALLAGGVALTSFNGSATGEGNLPAIKEPKAEPYKSDDPEYTTGTLPEFSPDGYKWILWLGSTDLKGAPLFQGPGMDASGKWWKLSGKAGVSDRVRFRDIDNFPGARPLLELPCWVETGEWTKSTGPWFLERVQTFTNEVVLPALAIAVGTAIGGVGGIAVAALITATNKISKGAPVSDALISSAKDGMTGVLKSGVFDKTIKLAKDNGLGEMIQYGKTLSTATEKTVFDQAQILARSYISQKVSIEELKSMLPADKARIVDAAIENGATPLDIAQALGGNEVKSWMDKALEKNAGILNGALSDLPIKKTAPIIMVSKDFTP